MEGRKNKKCKVRIIFMFLMFLAISTTFLPFRSFGGDMEILVDKLVGKGILTKPEAETILREMKETKEMEKGKTEVQKAKTETEPTKPEEKKVESPDWVKNVPDWIKNPPDWIKNFKLSGDLRLRYEYNHRDSTVNDDRERERGRFRWRLGVDTKIVDDVTVGFGLTSGSLSSASTTYGTVGDPRSTEQTFDSSFSKKPLAINYAFAQYKPLQWLSLVGGKLRTNPIFRANSLGAWSSELVWDNDITPEGAAVVLNYPGLLNLDIANLDVFMNNTFFLLDENNPSGSGREPYMVVIQPGFNLKIMKDINLKAALAKYLFFGIKNKTQLKFSANSNTLVGGSYKFDYDTWIGTAEVGYKNPFHQDIVPYVGLFGEYVYNPDPDTEKKAYLGGIRVGYPSINKFGDWQLSYAYRRLEKDSVLDILPDSTFYGGATNAKGHKASVYFGLAKNLLCDLNYFHSVNILENSTAPHKRPEDVVQVDIQFNF
jgi:hypothetical protein